MTDLSDPVRTFGPFILSAEICPPGTELKIRYVNDNQAVISWITLQAARAWNWCCSLPSEIQKTILPGRGA